MKIILPILTFFLLRTIVSAQPMTLEAFNQRFEKELEKISQKQEEQKNELDVKYLGALLRMETQAKNQGNLDLVQAVRAEIKRIENNEPLEVFGTSAPAELKEMQQVMENLQNGYIREEANATVQLVDSLKEYASSRSTEATRNNDIKDAVAWRDWEVNLRENEMVRKAYAVSGRPDTGGGNRQENRAEVHNALRGNPTKIITELTMEFSSRPKAYASGSEPKGNEKRIRSTTPSMQGAGNTQLTGTLILIEEKDIKKSGYYGTLKEKSLVYVPRLAISPIVGQSLDRCLVVFDLFKRGSGSKRSVIRTDEILIPALSASDKVVIDAGLYEYETEEWDSRWSSYDYKRSTEDEFYGFIVTIFNKEGKLIFQRASERMLNEYARETPPR